MTCACMNRHVHSLPQSMKLVVVCTGVCIYQHMCLTCVRACVCVCKPVYAQSLTVFPRTSFATEGSPQLWRCCQTQPAGQGQACHSQLYGRRDSTSEGWATGGLTRQLISLSLSCFIVQHACTQVLPIHTHMCAHTPHTPHTHTSCMHTHTYTIQMYVCTHTLAIDYCRY